MKLRRTPIAFAIVAVSLGLAACSDEPDSAAQTPPDQVTPGTGSSMETVPPAATPGTSNVTPPPVDPTSPPPGSDPAASGGTQNPVPDTAPSSSSAAPGLTQRLAHSGQALQASARDVAHTVGEKAGELREATGERMAQMGNAIREGAAKADAAIQESVDRGGTPTTNEPIQTASRP